MTMEIIPAYTRQEEIKELFREYMDYLQENWPRIKPILAAQGYEDEFAHLEQHYGGAQGRLYLALVDGKPAGCIALHQFRGKVGEIKRLYVRPEFRGHRLARKLLAKLLEEAQELGYERLVLDSLPVMQSALKLYASLGFVEIEKYYNTPEEETIFLGMELQKLGQC